MSWFTRMIGFSAKHYTVSASLPIVHSDSNSSLGKQTTCIDKMQKKESLPEQATFIHCSVHFYTALYADSLLTPFYHSQHKRTQQFALQLDQMSKPLLTTCINQPLVSTTLSTLYWLSFLGPI